MLGEVTSYLAAHPIVLGTFLLFVVLAVIGGWYVIAHYIHILLVTLLCAGGFASGVLVLVRGFKAEMRDLMAVGLFLMVIFPVIFQQAIKVAKMAPPKPSKPAAPSAKAPAETPAKTA